MMVSEGCVSEYKAPDSAPDLLYANDNNPRKCRGLRTKLIAAAITKACFHAGGKLNISLEFS